MAIELVVWDYNGTLTDDFSRFAKAVNLALEQRGILPATAEEIACYDGNIPAFYQRRGLHPGEMRDLVFDIYSRFSDGIPLREGAIKTLESISLPQLLMTKHPTSLAEKEIDALDIRRYFSQIYSGVSDKAFLLQELFLERKIPPHSAIIIGDQITDIIDGKRAGSRTIGLPGYHPAHILEKCKPDYLVDSVGKIPGLIKEIS